MKSKIYHLVLLILCSLWSLPQALSQDTNSAESKAAEMAAMKKEIIKEVSDSLSKVNDRPERSERPTVFTNNENISREKLEISYEVKDILMGSESVAVGTTQQDGISVNIPEADVSDVRKEWEKVIKKKTKSKVVSTDDGLSITATIIDELSEKPINVYSTVRDSDYGVKVVSSFEVDSVFMTEEEFPAKYRNARKFMENFGLEQYRLSVKGEIKREKKTYKDLEGTLSKYQRENKKYHKNVKDNEQNILNTESAIDQNHLDQDDALAKVRAQKKVVSKLSGDPKKEAQKVQKELDNAYKKLQRDNKSMHKKIVNYRADIEKSKRKIELNLSEQDLQKSVISKQLSVVKSLEQKLLKVK